MAGILVFIEQRGGEIRKASLGDTLVGGAEGV